MSVVELLDTSLEVSKPYEDLSSSEVLGLMQQVAYPGQDILEPRAVIDLRELTCRLIELNGEQALAEHNRYTSVQTRELEINKQKLREQIENKTILVTGGTGLIGSALMAELTQFNPERMVSISRGETTASIVVPGVDYLTADIRDKARIDEIVGDVRPEIIYHVAADKYNHEAEQRARHTLTTNIDGTQNILEAAEAADVSQVIYASTGKATRPYSPDIYASSKKTGEWLLSEAAVRGKLLCSAVRFTHVVDDSNLRKKVNERIDDGLPVTLQGPDVWLYIQSARESAQLLLNAGLEAEQGVLKVQAIRDLGMPVNLTLFGLGAIVKKNAQVPIYFRGVVAGYEDKAWPHLYGLECGDYSPLINSFESEEAVPSETCPQIDMFPLRIKKNAILDQKLEILQQACSDPSTPSDVLRSLNQSLSWEMLSARLAEVPYTALQRIEKRIKKYPEEVSPEHAFTDEIILSALTTRETVSAGSTQ